MTAILLFLRLLTVTCFRSRAALAAENLALRHQRASRPLRPKLWIGPRKNPRREYPGVIEDKHYIL